MPWNLILCLVTAHLVYFCSFARSEISEIFQKKKKLGRVQPLFESGLLNFNPGLNVVTKLLSYCTRWHLLLISTTSIMVSIAKQNTFDSDFPSRPCFDESKMWNLPTFRKAWDQKQVTGSNCEGKRISQSFLIVR